MHDFHGWTVQEMFSKKVLSPRIADNMGTFPGQIECAEAAVRDYNNMSGGSPRIVKPNNHRSKSRITFMKNILKEAKQILLRNWNGEFTVAGYDMYPHHWGWDTPVVASAYACFDVEKGMQELKHLLDAQWDNGMIPQIVFQPGADSYFPGPDFYDVHRSPDAPDGVQTSGLIQPPTQAIGLYYLLGNHLDNQKVRDFVSEQFDRVMDFHRYLMRYRDPEDSGGITIFHPWECMDDLPVFDEALARLEIEDLPDYERKDLQHIENASERPPDDFYDCFVYLVDRMRKKNYDFEAIYRDHQFKFRDVVNTSILYAANNCLIDIGDELDRDTTEVENWQNTISSHFWANFQPGDDADLFYSFDQVAEEHVEKPTIASLVPLFSGLLPPAEAEPLLRVIENFQFCDGRCIKPLIPTTSFADEDFSHETYWRGPVWAMTSWMIYCGLCNYGRYDLADTVRNGFLELVKEEGFREYYSPLTGEGKGVDDFVWTAAVVIDMLEEDVRIPYDFTVGSTSERSTRGFRRTSS